MAERPVLPQDVVIDRARWIQNNYSNGATGVVCHCAVGFICAALGDPDCDDDTTDAVEDELLHRGVRVGLIFRANDDEDALPEEREAELTRLFDKVGIALTFEGEYT